MNKFNCYELPDKTYVVNWPSLQETFNKDMKINLLELVFGDMGCYEIGVVTSLLSDTAETFSMWIKSDIWYSQMTQEYTIYLHKQYNIHGVLFHDKSDAEHFREILEKKYIWQLLKE